MAYDETLAARIRAAFRGRRDVTERKMFGGLSFMYRGRMCCGVIGTKLVVRVVPDEFAVAVRRKHVRPMDFTGKPLKGFVYVPAAGLRTGSALLAWIKRGERFVRLASAESARRPRGRRNVRSAGQM